MLHYLIALSLLFLPSCSRAESDYDCRFDFGFRGQTVAYGKRLADGTWGCWGSGANGPIADCVVPAAVTDEPNFSQTAWGGGCIFIKIEPSDGSLTGWQHCGDGGSPSDTFGILADIPAGTGYLDVAIGGASACAIKSDNTVECWGEESYDDGTCGAVPHYDVICNAFRDPITWASPSSGPSGNYAAISAERSSIFCGLKTDTTIDCWGNEGSNTAFFAGVPGGSGWDQVYVTGDEAYACARKASDGNLTCWGNAYGTGDNNPSSNDGPAAPAVAYDINNIVVFPGGGCGISEVDDRVDCWGASYITGDANLTAPGLYAQRKLIAADGQVTAISDVSIGGTAYKRGSLRTMNDQLDDQPACVYTPVASIYNLIQ